MIGNTLDYGLLRAAACGDLEKVKETLNAGANIDAVNMNGQTALMIACVHKYSDIVRFLLDRGADINITDDHRNTVLAAACWNVMAGWRGHTDIVRLLLERGANPNVADIYNETVLIIATYDGNTDIVELLLKYGADANYRNDSKNTALINACKEGKADIKTIKLLLKYGADPNAMDKDGNTALMYAASKGLVKHMEALIKAGADADMKNTSGWDAFDLFKTYYPEKYAKWIEKTIIKPKQEKLRKEDSPDLTGQFVDWDI